VTWLIPANRDLEAFKQFINSSKAKKATYRHTQKPATQRGFRLFESREKMCSD
jgi:heme-degrading monooxygenase HmoA